MINFSGTGPRNDPELGNIPILLNSLFWNNPNFKDELFGKKNRRKVKHRHERKPPMSEQEKRFVIYRNSAKKRDIEFSIDFKLFLEFWGKSCYYCGSNIIFIGIDRVDSNIGYIPGNLVSCCTWCNLAKRKETKDGFIKRCRLVVEHFTVT